jgi:hypothetical protein
VEQVVLNADIALDGMCEGDETYVLESVKGRKIPEGYHREPRKHGAIASKRGISNESIRVCASVGGDNKCVALAVNRATPSREGIARVFGNKVTSDAVILCDGSKNYDVLEGKCEVARTKRVNKVNGFRSFMKERLVAARGVATIYLNRYNVLFSQIYREPDVAANKIFEIMTARNSSFSIIATVKTQNLLIV